LKENYIEQANNRLKVEIIYEDYRRNFCSVSLLEPKKRAEFGKIVRMAFPGVKKRRLGPAGAQVSYYVGLTAIPPSPPAQPSEFACLSNADVDGEGSSGEEALDRMLMWDMHADDVMLGVEEVSLIAQANEISSGSLGYGAGPKMTATRIFGLQMITNGVGGLGLGGGGGGERKKSWDLTMAAPLLHADNWMPDFPSYAFFFSDLLSDTGVNT